MNLQGNMSCWDVDIFVKFDVAVYVEIPKLLCGLECRRLTVHEKFNVHIFTPLFPSNVERLLDTTASTFCEGERFSFRFRERIQVNG